MLTARTTRTILRSTNARLLAAFALAHLCAFPATSFGQRRSGSEAVYKNAVVACDHPLASQAGLEILKKGGNVVDAAVAASFALTVVRPASCGLGGGGFMVIWDAKAQKSVALDYRERAPKAASREMFVEANRNGTLTSQYGHLASGVPGNVAGLALAAKKYGTLPLTELLQPALRLAREGIPVDANERSVQTTVLGQFKRLFPNDASTKFAPLIRGYLNEGKPWSDADRFYSPQRAALESLAKHGADSFYRGEIAAALVTESQRGGGLFTAADLEDYRPVERDALRQTYSDFEVLTMPPPSSGGIALVQILNILNAWQARQPAREFSKLGPTNPRYQHLLVEAMKHAFADRAEFLGDSDFVDVPVKRLVSRDYANNLLNRILPGATRPPADYGRFAPPRDGGTSHISIIDRHGNAVACTETINTFFGSKVVEPKFGIVLNNEMDDFSAVPGKPNAFGLIQSENNAVAPGKRPLSSMTPTIILRNGQATFVAGASGGPRIISATLQVLLNQIYFDMTPLQAVSQPRLHHQWMPDRVYYEPKIAMPLRDALSSRGHKLQERGALGVSQTVSRSKEGLRGASDPRKFGAPAGF